jgi:hypothetical protein
MSRIFGVAAAVWVALTAFSAAQGREPIEPRAT